MNSRPEIETEMYPSLTCKTHLTYILPMEISHLMLVKSCLNFIIGIRALGILIVTLQPGKNCSTIPAMISNRFSLRNLN